MPPFAIHGRGQMAGQIFIYVLAVVVMGAILIYGYSAITDFRSKSEKISSIRLQSELSSTIHSLSSDFGSVKKKEIPMEGFSSICFVESHEIPRLDDPSIDPLIRDSVSSSTGKNVFLLRKSVEASFTVDPLSVDPDVLCIPARGNAAHIRLEGRGDHVLLSSYQES